MLQLRYILVTIPIYKFFLSRYTFSVHFDESAWSFQSCYAYFYKTYMLKSKCNCCLRLWSVDNFQPQTCWSCNKKFFVVHELILLLSYTLIYLPGYTFISECTPSRSSVRCLGSQIFPSFNGFLYMYAYTTDENKPMVIMPSLISGFTSIHFTMQLVFVTDFIADFKQVQPLPHILYSKK